MVGGCTHGYVNRCPYCVQFFSNGYSGTTPARVIISYSTVNNYGSTYVEEFKEASVAALKWLQDLALCTVSLAELFRPWLPPPARLISRRYRRAARAKQPRRFSRYRLRR